MYRAFPFILLSCLFSVTIQAQEKTFEMLAGIEAGIDSETAMTSEDLDKTQEVLSTYKTGSQESWYNPKTTTHYKLKIDQHFSEKLRPCVSYQLETRHDSHTEEKELKACLNYDGNWISMTNL